VDTLVNLRAFLATVRGGNFSEAARQLNTVPSVVSKRIGQLEWALGARLFERTSRKMVLTEAGQRFHVRARSLVAQFDDIASGLQREDDGLQGHLRVKAPTSVTVSFLADILSEFQTHQPGITLEMVLADRSVNPLEEGFDVAVAGRDASYDAVVDIPLCPLRQVVCASPAYLRRHGVPEHPRDLVDHHCLVFTPTGTIWHFDSPRGPVSVDVTAKLGANDNTMLLAGVRAGNGIAILPTYLARNAIEFGLVTPLLTDYPLRERWLKAMVPQRRMGVQRVEALLAWLKQHLGEVPPWDR